MMFNIDLQIPFIAQVS